MGSPSNVLVMVVPSQSAMAKCRVISLLAVISGVKSDNALILLSVAKSLNGPPKVLDRFVPVNLSSAVLTRQYAGNDKQQVRESIEILECILIDLLLILAC